MKKVKYLPLALIFLALGVQAQYQKVRVDSESAKNHQVPLNAHKSGIMTATDVRHSSLLRNLPEWNQNLVGFAKVHELPENVQREIDQKTQLKIKNLKGHYPDEPKGPASDNPVLGTNFSGNVFAGLTPPDNSMAISNGGYIVSVVNATVEYYDMSGNQLYSSSFTNFFNDPGLTGLLYDPAVLYDSGSDRFFMVVLSTTTSATSEVVCCFSQSNNPNDGWWYYKLTGNPLSNGCWFDYPKIGVSNNEVYVTGNLFTDAFSYNTSVIYQMTKASGYGGLSMAWQYWANITNAPFTMVPASYGQSGNYGPGIYLISTEENGSSDKIDLFDLTDDLTGSPTINAYQVAADFNLGGNAVQYGSTVVLNTDDTRAFSAFYLNGIVHFTFHSERILSSGYNGINYNRLTVSPLANVTQNFGLDGYDYCYPSVASFGSNAGDKAVLITFSRSGSDIYPETRVVYVDDAGNFSGSTLVKAGETFVDVYQGGGVTRWGDYTGISRKQDSSPPEVWLNGSYGAVQAGENALNTWIGQVTWETTGIAKTPPATTSRVFPNPASDIFKLEFSMEKSAVVEIDLIDGSGRLVKLLLKDRAEEGKNLFSFNKGVLTNGVYFLQVKSENKIVANEKIVID